MAQRALHQLENQVNHFNQKHPVGSTVVVKKGGTELSVTVKAEATVLNGHSAVGWFNEISGCYDLDMVIN